MKHGEKVNKKYRGMYGETGRVVAEDEIYRQKGEIWLRGCKERGKGV